MLFAGHQRVSARCGHSEAQAEREATTSNVSGCHYQTQRGSTTGTGVLLTSKWARRCSRICPGGKGLKILGVSTVDSHGHIMSHLGSVDSPCTCLGAPSRWMAFLCGLYPFLQIVRLSLFGVMVGEFLQIDFAFTSAEETQGFPWLRTCSSCWFLGLRFHTIWGV